MFLMNEYLYVVDSMNIKANQYRSGDFEMYVLQMMWTNQNLYSFEFLVIPIIYVRVRWHVQCASQNKFFFAPLHQTGGCSSKLERISEE